MTKDERTTLQNDSNYFDGVLSALNNGLFKGSDAQNLLALQATTVEKGRLTRIKLDEEAKRISDLIDKPAEKKLKSAK